MLDSSRSLHLLSLSTSALPHTLLDITLQVQLVDASDDKHMLQVCTQDPVTLGYVTVEPRLNQPTIVWGLPNYTK